MKLTNKLALALLLACATAHVVSAAQQKTHLTDLLNQVDKLDQEDLDSTLAKADGCTRRRLCLY